MTEVERGYYMKDVECLFFFLLYLLVLIRWGLWMLFIVAFFSRFCSSTPLTLRKGDAIMLRQKVEDINTLIDYTLKMRR